MTLFTFRRFPRDTAARVWDLLLVDGPKTLFRVALAVLYLGQDTLLAGDFETIFNWTKQLPDQKLLNEHAVIKTALTFQVTNSLLDRLAAQYWYVWTQHCVSRSANRCPLNIYFRRQFQE